MPVGVAVYTEVEHVATMFIRAPADALLVVDAGGLGRPVVEYLRTELGREARRCIGVQITSGTAAKRRTGCEWPVPKFDLVRGVEVALETGRLVIPPEAEGAQDLRRELEDFRYQYTKSSRPRLTFNARPGCHDDMLVAVALGIWGARGLTIHVSATGEDCGRR